MHFRSDPTKIISEDCYFIPISGYSLILNKKKYLIKSDLVKNIFLKNEKKKKKSYDTLINKGDQINLVIYIFFKLRKCLLPPTIHYQVQDIMKYFTEVLYLSKVFFSFSFLVYSCSLFTQLGFKHFQRCV